MDSFFKNFEECIEAIVTNTFANLNFEYKLKKET